MANVPELTEAEYEAKVTNAEHPVVVDFGAEWCAPCKALAPILEEVAAEFDGQVDVYAVDIGKAPELAAKFGVMSVPTLIAVKNGSEADRSVGLVPKDRLQGFFKTLLG
jgi:thioredoxin 1